MFNFITNIAAFFGIIILLLLLFYIYKILKHIFSVKSFKGKLIIIICSVIVLSLFVSLFEKPFDKLINDSTVLAVLGYLVLIAIVIHIVYKIIRLQFNLNYTISQLDSMEGHQFEYACANILRANGFKSVKVTQGSGDFGVDVLAEKNGIRYAIQCKCYSNKLNNKPIQEVIGGLAYYGCSKGAVMTNQYFTEPAKELARINGVELWDRDVLQSWLRKCTKSNDKLKDIKSLSNEISKSIIKDNSDELSNNLIWKAIVVIADTESVTTSFVQRKLMLGYSKSAKILDSIEKIGLISSTTENKLRTVNIHKDDLPYIKDKFYQEIIDLNTIINDTSNEFNQDTQSKENERENLEKYSIKSTLLNDLEKNKEIYQHYLTSVGTSFASYFYLNDLYVTVEKIVIHYETNTAIFECSLHEQTKVSKLKKHLKSIAKYAGVKYAEYFYPTTTPYTIGIKIPLPEYLERTSTLIHELNEINKN